MPTHEGFVQAYNGQAAVDVDSMLIVAATLTQQTNDLCPRGYKQQVEPMLNELDKLPSELSKPDTLLADLCPVGTTVTSAKTTSKPAKTEPSRR